MVTKEDRPRVRVDRRQVLRTGAWSVPVIAVGVGAPAFAASGVARIQFDTFNVFGADYSAGRPTSLESQVQIQHLFQTGDPNVTPVTFTAAYPDTRVAGAAPTSVSGPGWSYSGVAHVGSTWVYTFVYGPPILNGGSSTTLDFKVPMSNNAPGTVSIVGTADAPQVLTPITQTISYTIN